MKVYHQVLPVLCLLISFGNIYAAPTSENEVADNYYNETSTEAVPVQVTLSSSTEAENADYFTTVTTSTTTEFSPTTSDAISSSTETASAIDRMDDNSGQFVMSDNGNEVSNNRLFNNIDFDKLVPLGGADPLDSLAYSILLEHLNRPPSRISTDGKPIVTGYFVMDTEMEGQNKTQSEIVNPLAYGSSEASSLPKEVRPPLVNSKSEYGFTPQHHQQLLSRPMIPVRTSSDQTAGFSSNNPQQLNIEDIFSGPFMSQDVFTQPGEGASKIVSNSYNTQVENRLKDSPKYGVHILSPFSDKAIGGSFVNTLSDMLKPKNVKYLSFPVSQNPGSQDYSTTTESTESAGNYENPFGSSITGPQPDFFNMEELIFENDGPESTTATTTSTTNPPSSTFRTSPSPYQFKQQINYFTSKPPTNRPEVNNMTKFTVADVSPKPPQFYTQQQQLQAANNNFVRNEMKHLYNSLKSGSQNHQVAKNQSGSGYNLIRVTPQMYEKLMKSGSLKQSGSGSPILDFVPSSSSTTKPLFVTKPLYFNPTIKTKNVSHYSVSHKTPDSSELLKHPEIFIKSHYQKPASLINKNNSPNVQTVYHNVAYDYIHTHPMSSTSTTPVPSSTSSAATTPRFYQQIRTQNQTPVTTPRYMPAQSKFRQPLPPGKSYETMKTFPSNVRPSSPQQPQQSASIIQKAVEVLTHYSDEYPGRQQQAPKEVQYYKRPEASPIHQYKEFIPSTPIPSSFQFPGGQALNSGATASSQNQIVYYRPSGYQRASIFNPSGRVINNSVGIRTDSSPAPSRNYYRHQQIHGPTYSNHAVVNSPSNQEMTYESIDFAQNGKSHQSASSPVVQIFRNRAQMESALKTLTGAQYDPQGVAASDMRYSTVIVPRPRNLKKSYIPMAMITTGAFNKGLPPIPLRYDVLKTIVKEVI